MTQNTIHLQDNAQLQALVAAFEQAYARWIEAIDTWDTDPTSEPFAAALNEAERQAREAAAALAVQVAAWVRAGYRLAD